MSLVSTVNFSPETIDVRYDFTYMWNLLNKISYQKTNRNRLLDTENRLTAVRGKDGWEAG